MTLKRLITIGSGTRESEIDALAKAKRDAVVVNISAAEMASWPIKRAEAIAHAASGLESDAPMLAVEATARGVTLAALVARVQANATMFSTLEAQIAGVAGKHRDAIAELQIAALADYDITTGWPV